MSCFSTHMVVALIVALCQIPLTAAHACSEPTIIQVVEGRYDAGITTRDGFRLQDGSLSRARWTDANALVGLSIPVQLGDAAARAARKILESAKPTVPPTIEPGMAISPPTYTLEISASGCGKNFFTFRNQSTNALNDLLADWRGSAPLKRQKGGTFVWTMPAPRNPGRSDLGAADAFAPYVAAAWQHGIAARISDTAARAFIKQGNTGRARFIGRLNGTFLYFGVLGAR